MNTSQPATNLLEAGPTQSQVKPKSKRRLELDVLRFVAVALVLGRHMVPCPSENPSVASAFSNLWLQGGWIGVDMFFVLSGFLVSGLLFHEFKKYNSIDMPRFLLRRALKIYPAFWALIAATVTMSWIGYPTRKGYIWSELLFVQNYFPGLWNHTWSLAVEEHFYLLLAGIVSVLVYQQSTKNGAFSKNKFAKNTPASGVPAKDPLDAIPVLFGITAVVCLLLRVITTCCQSYNHETHLFPTHLRIDSLMFGVLLSHSWQRGGFVKSKWVRDKANSLIGCGIALLLPAFLFPLETTSWIPVFGVICFYVGSGAILIGLLHRGLPKTASVKLMAKLGAYSYSIYLWHMPVHVWFVPEIMDALPTSLQGNWFLYLALFLTGSFVFGVLMGKLIEAPVLALRDKWFPSRSKALALQAEKVESTDSIEFNSSSKRSIMDSILKS